MNPPLLQIKKNGRQALWIGVAGSLLCLAGAAFNPPQFYQSWLVAWLSFIGLSLGALVIVMMQWLTGGAWGFAIRRLSEAAMLTLPVMAILFLPIIAGVHDLFPWSRPGAIAAHAKWAHRQGYLNVPFFIARSVIYFAVLSALAFGLRHYSAMREQSGNPAPASRRLGSLSGGGLVLYVLCMNFASTDWVMSLEPDWYSTIFVVIFMAGQFLAALAVMTALLALFATREPFASAILPKHFHDLGNLLLTFVIFWAYVSFSQFLIIWSGNLPKEISWYLPRSAGGWKALVFLLMVFQFLAPFALLLSRATKRKRERIRAIAFLIALAGVVNIYWLVVPSFHPEGVHIHWLDFATFVAVGGFWAAGFLHFLARQPLLPLISDEVPS